jgi:uncharacterized protein DUF4255
LRRPRVICELSTYLGILLKAGLRSGAEGDPGVFLLEHPQEIEREGPSPSFFLHLHRVLPDRRAPRAGSIVEAASDAQPGLRLEYRHPPLWISCRYLLGMKGRGPEEEAEMVAAALRTLMDHPVVSLEHLPSLRGWAPRAPGAGHADRFPLEIVEGSREEEGWRAAGLVRARITVSFQVTVPIPSALSEPLERVLDREIRIQELT